MIQKKLIHAALHTTQADRHWSHTQNLSSHHKTIQRYLLSSTIRFWRHPLFKTFNKNSNPLLRPPLRSTPFPRLFVLKLPPKTFIKSPQHTKMASITHHVGKPPHSLSMPRIRLNLCAPKLCAEEMCSSCVLSQCYRYHMYICVFVCMYVCKQPCTSLYMSVCI